MDRRDHGGAARDRAGEGPLSRTPSRALSLALLLSLAWSGLSVSTTRPALALEPRTFVEAESVLVHGTYPPFAESECNRGERAPLHIRVPGRVEVGRASDGTLFVVNELPFETYVSGIAEVPRDWPMAALEAQVIAARTYALGHLGGDPDGLGYDLCATDACQVYRGMQVSHGPWGTRWRAAIDATRGQALLYQGRPASTVYFSTSNGRTYGNEEVFEGAGPLPYLRGVTEEDDGASPVSRWTASIPLADVTRFLRSSGDWAAEGPIASIDQDGSDLILRAAGGRTSRISKTSFRIAINDRSICLDPGDYPGEDLEDDDDPRNLPQTIPSKWFDGRTQGGTFYADGRGWGHGAGMVQWGAYGKALRGVSASDILAFYYGGLRPQPGNVPDSIRVLAAEGLESVTLVPDGLGVKGDRLAGNGPWRIEPANPLRVQALAKNPDPALEVTFEGPPQDLDTRRTWWLTAETNNAVIVTSLELIGPGRSRGVHEVGRPNRPHPRGTWRQRFTIPADVPSGTYALRAVITDGVDLINRHVAEVRVLGAPFTPVASTPVPGPTGTTSALPIDGERSLRLVLLAVVLALLGMSLLAYARRVRRG